MRMYTAPLGLDNEIYPTREKAEQVGHSMVSNSQEAIHNSGVHFVGIVQGICAPSPRPRTLMFSFHGDSPAWQLEPGDAEMLDQVAEIHGRDPHAFINFILPLN